MTSRASTAWPEIVRAHLPASMSRKATPTLSPAARTIMLTPSCDMAPSSIDEIGRADRAQHVERSSSVELARVSGRRTAAAGRKSDQLHAELVEIAVTAGELPLDLDPELVEGHRLVDEHARDLRVVAHANFPDQLEPPLRPEVAQMD